MNMVTLALTKLSMRMTRMRKLRTMKNALCPEDVVHEFEE